MQCRNVPCAPLTGGRGRHLALVGPLDSALDAARACPETRLSLFAPDWPEVDAARAAIRDAGLTGRVSARHIDALPLAAALSLDVLTLN